MEKLKRSTVGVHGFRFTAAVAAPVPNAARLLNRSTRGLAQTGDNVLIPGFVVSGEGPKTLLVRVVGPTLGGFGVANTMADPKLTIFSGPTPLFANDDWGDNPDAADTAGTADLLGAFPLA